MKEKIEVFREENLLFKGNILNIPIKEEIIIQKSIEVFNDDDPCIIHQSYIIKELVSDLLGLFRKSGGKVLLGSTYKNELLFLNFEDVESITIKLMG